ncbi:hypothetical protein [Roseovarius nitratireducens]|uniref:hypothetical protein n=1 Tax=Roseovarius nitratireducens TaxID=2044597 RepID=UPI000CE21E0E|nr:hypothetical protein [Roseovarius nitratireducens]
MQDRTIDNALLALRKQIIRDDLGGMDHVEALLQMRGVDAPRVMPPKRKDVARRGHMTALVLRALGEGGKTLREVVSYVCQNRPELPYTASYKRTGQALANLKKRGLVRREGRVWLSKAADHPAATT